MAELVDALDSKSCDSNIVRVRFPLWAQEKNSLPSPGEGFLIPSVSREAILYMKE